MKALLVKLLIVAISWTAIVLATIVIGLCFGLHLTVLNATGVWIALCILKCVFD